MRVINVYAWYNLAVHSRAKPYRVFDVSSFWQLCLQIVILFLLEEHGTQRCCFWRSFTSV